MELWDDWLPKCYHAWDSRTIFYFRRGKKKLGSNFFKEIRHGTVPNRHKHKTKTNIEF